MRLGLACYIFGSLPVAAAAVEAPPATFVKFDQWWQEYFTAAEEARPGLVDKGVPLAASRREEMIRLIETSPQTALSLAFPEEYHSALPKLILPNVELHVRGLASLKVDKKEPVRRRVTLGDKTWLAYVSGVRRQLTSRAEIPIHGIVLGGKIALDASPLERFPARESLLNVLRNSEGKKTCPICGENGVIPAAVGDLLMWFDSEEHLQMCEKAIIEKEMSPEIGE